MPRIARVIAPGLPHHITHRGNYFQNIFDENKDYLFYLKLFNKYAQQYLISILSYCLMPNHVHFIIIPKNKDAIAKVFNITQMIYAQYVNNKRKMKGHLWQGRFYSCILDEKHLYAAARYVEQNPLRAKLVKIPWDWQWSSARDHSDKTQKGIIKLTSILNYLEINDWKQFISEPVEEDFLKNIRKSTMTGRPIGDVNFIEKLETKLNRKFTFLPRGRPKKVKKGK